MLTEAEQAHAEGAKNLWRYKGRGTLAIVAIVAGLFIFAKVDAASDPGPSGPPLITHHAPVGPSSNGAPPVFTP